MHLALIEFGALKRSTAGPTRARASSPIFKRVLDDLQAGISRPLDTNYVKAVIYTMKFVAIPIFSCHARNLSLFMLINRFFGSAVLPMGAKLDFNKYQNIFVPTDEINFSKASSILASHNLVAIAPQIAVGK